MEDPILKAARRALLHPERDWEDENTEVIILAAVRPLIEREVREQIAREIEADRDRITALLQHTCISLNRAARIARGGDHE